MRFKIMSRHKGFTLVEVLVGVFIFTILALGIYQGYFGIAKLVRLSRVRTAAALAANAQLEIIRNMPFAQVGLVGGVPSGSLPRTQVLSTHGYTFNATTTIRNIDDEFDGTIGGSPNDTAPADYKLVEIELACNNCHLTEPLTFTTSVSPRGLETSTGNGALFVRVVDANGLPVPDASVHIENQAVDPAIVIDEETDVDGYLQLVDIPPGSFSYEISVSKSGYSAAETYPPDDPDIPNPVNIHSTVAAGQVTQITFTIDKLSSFHFQTLDAQCLPVGSVDFTLTGSKLIGTEPDRVKYASTQITNANGERVVSNLEWDTYQVALTDNAYHLAGAVPLLPLALTPDTNQQVTLTVVPKNPNDLLVVVKDAATGLPLSGAAVTIGAEAKTTDQGFFKQSDWSGGSGQESFAAANRYWEDDGGVNVSVVGEFKLRSVFEEFVGSGFLTSSVFDTGATTTTYYGLDWASLSQPAQTGANSVRFQIATAPTNTATTSWEFVGPDGSPASYYSVGSQDIAEQHDGDRYVRYRSYLSTADQAYSPTISDVSLTYGSSCLPPGQVLFSGLSDGVYEVTVSKEGYQAFSNPTVVVSQDWQLLEVNLVAQ